jgi:hypothetical protein
MTPREGEGASKSYNGWPDTQEVRPASRYSRGRDVSLYVRGRVTWKPSFGTGT